MSMDEHTEENNTFVENITEDFTYTWIIKEFSKMRKGLGIISPVFPESEWSIQWQIEFWPYGYSNKKFSDVRIYPVNWNGNERIHVLSFSATILDFDGNKSKIGNTSYSNVTFFNFSRPLNKSIFLRRCDIKKFVFHDVLKIQVTIQVLIETKFHHENKQKNVSNIMELTKPFESTLNCDDIGEKNHTCINKLAEDLESGLNSRDFSDFIIEVDDIEIAVHKIILSSRSPVFSAILKTDISEKNPVVVRISDVDKNTMSSLVRFMYTTKVDISTIEEAQNLFIAADKYQLNDLKDLCENYLISNLRSSNAIDVFIFSEHRNDLTMKNKIVEFITKNMQDFLEDKCFEKLIGEPTLLLELLKKK